MEGVEQFQLPPRLVGSFLKLGDLARAHNAPPRLSAPLSNLQLRERHFITFDVSRAFMSSVPAPCPISL
jgi:hypothetical protein